MKRKDIRPSFSKIWNTESDVFYPGNKKKMAQPDDTSIFDGSTVLWKCVKWLMLSNGFVVFLGPLPV